MRDFVHDGDVMNVAAPGGRALFGAGILIGELFGVAASTTAEGGSMAVATESVYGVQEAARIAVRVRLNHQPL